VTKRTKQEKSCGKQKFTDFVAKAKNLHAVRRNQ